MESTNKLIMKRILIISALTVLVSLGISGFYTNKLVSSNNKKTLPKKTLVATVTSNVWLSPNGDDLNCARSNIPVDSSSIIACKTIQVACDKATGGDSIAVQSGIYAAPQYQRYIQRDCSDGLGTDVNWNESPYSDLSRAKNWVTFKCGDDNSFNAIKNSLQGFTFLGNEHVIFDGGPNQCFYFRGSVIQGEGGDTTLTTKNIALYRVHLDGIFNKGAQNTLILNSSMGPNITCGKYNDPNVDPKIACNPDGPYWESQWANYGTATSSCTPLGNASGGSACGGNSNALGFEPIIGQNSGGIKPIGTRWDGNWIHDQNVKDISKWHPGCVLFLDSGSQQVNPRPIVFTGNTCERVAVQNIEWQSAAGVDVTNNFFGVPTKPCQQDSSCIADAPTGQQSMIFKTSNPTWGPNNINVAYNTIERPIIVPSGTYTNVNIIGNLQLLGNPSTCGVAGVNYVGNIICGGGDRSSDVIQSGQGTANFFVDYPIPVINLHLTGDPKSYEDSVNASSGGLDNNIDIDSEVRSDPRTAGADQRDIILPPPTTTTDTTSTTTSSSTTTTEPPPVDIDRMIFCNEFVPNIQGNTYYNKWINQNPNEKIRWQTFRDGICSGNNPVIPSMLTLYGKALVNAGEMAIN